MNVRHMLFTVLPCYTMRGANLPVRPTLALIPEPDSAQPVTAKLRVVKSQPEGDDARVMGHD